MRPPNASAGSASTAGCRNCGTSSRASTAPATAGCASTPTSSTTARARCACSASIRRRPTGAAEAGDARWEAQAFEDAAAQAGPGGHEAAQLRAVGRERAGTHCGAAPVHHQPHRRRPARGLAGAGVGRDRWKACACWTSPHPRRSGRRPRLAAYGADVMLVNAPHLPNIEAIADTSRASARHWWTCAEGGAAMDALLAGRARVRAGLPPGALAQLGQGAGTWRGAGPASSMSLRLWTRGCVARTGAASTRWCRPPPASTWRRRSGRRCGKPLALPMQILDEATGYLIAFGAAAALLRQQREGEAGTCRCRWRRPATGCASLAGGARLRRDGAGLEPFLETTASRWGALRGVEHSAQLGRTGALAPPVGATRRFCRAGKFILITGRPLTTFDGLGLRSWQLRRSSSGSRIAPPGADEGLS